MRKYEARGSPITTNRFLFMKITDNKNAFSTGEGVVWEVVQGVSRRRGCVSKGGCPGWFVCPGGVMSWGCWRCTPPEPEADTPLDSEADPPPVNKMTDRCNNITVTRMHSSRMHTACSSSRPGGLYQAPPRDQAPPGADPPDQAPPREQTPLPRDQATPPPVNRMTDRCKNITFPHTSFAGGNNCHPVQGWIQAPCMRELLSMRGTIPIFFPPPPPKNKIEDILVRNGCRSVTQVWQSVSQKGKTWGQIIFLTFGIHSACALPYVGPTSQCRRHNHHHHRPRRRECYLPGLQQLWTSLQKQMALSLCH